MFKFVLPTLCINFLLFFVCISDDSVHEGGIYNALDGDLILHSRDFHYN